MVTMKIMGVENHRMMFIFEKVKGVLYSRNNYKKNAVK